MTFNLTRRHLLAAAGAAGGLSLLPRGAFAAEELVAATFGGSWAEVHKQILKPYFEEKTGATVSQSPMLATEQIAKLTAAKGGEPPFDVAMLDEGPALEAIDAGLIAPFDASKSPNYADLPEKFQGEYGPAITMQAIGIAYNPETIKTPPTSWEDLWKPEYAGRVGITSLASTLGLAFLLDINRLEGGDESNMDAGFKKLQSLLPNLAAVSANFGAHGALFQQGEIDIGVQNFNFAEVLKAKGVPIEFVKVSTGTPGWKTTMHVVKGATKSDLAHAYIDSQLSADVQSEMAKAPWNTIPTNSKVPVEGIVAEKFGSTPEDLEKFVFFDWKKVNEGRAAWTDQFNRDIRI
ncbi:Spermidine/putrescine-binding periplasmic protein precursor [Hartmannibacter diazotrophicus]|uniref:Spermidine/putrescine-binding periplasmic protein n=1 Tax=Hartmannibacter diazotrophicus TaxID=1482074 RepID=A0A2C9D8W1_9HYPH|nr:ABC transporter substrate-binding protein [Hartmannibacter diazotrophicus]SON56752.1 Spermidine/putrescine-binding periplasmic protein precursor [Hartmannibacter diazotrophicus]